LLPDNEHSSDSKSNVPVIWDPKTSDEGLHKVLSALCLDNMLGVGLCADNNAANHPSMLLKHAARQWSSEKVKARSNIAHHRYSQLQQSWVEYTPKSFVSLHNSVCMDTLDQSFP
jgi:hypothetical protein